MKGGRNSQEGFRSSKFSKEKGRTKVRPFEWYHRDSNLGHTDFQSVALPTELWYQLSERKHTQEIGLWRPRKSSFSACDSSTGLQVQIGSEPSLVGLYD